MKKDEIKKILDLIASKKGITVWLSDAKSESLAEQLSKLHRTDRASVKQIIDSISIYVKESVDFTDTNYLLDQIVDLINKD